MNSNYDPNNPPPPNNAPNEDKLWQTMRSYAMPGPIEMYLRQRELSGEGGYIMPRWGGQPVYVSESFLANPDVQRIFQGLGVYVQNLNQPGPSGERWAVVNPEEGYWENPQRVARYYNIIRTAPPDWKPPSWLDAKQIEAAYKYLQYRNDNKEWTQWKSLPENDPGIDFIRKIPAPPPYAWTPSEQTLAKLSQRLQPSAVEEIKKNFPMTPEEIASQQPVDWSQLPLAEQMIVSTLMPYSNIENRPESSRLLSSGVQGLMAALGGRALGSVAGRVLGGLVAGAIGSPAAIPIGMAIGSWVGTLGVGGAAAYQAYSGNQVPAIDDILKWFDALAIGAKRTIGTVRQLGTGDIDSYEELKSAWDAGELAYAAAKIDSINGFFNLLDFIDKIAFPKSDPFGLEKIGDFAEDNQIWLFSQGYVQPITIPDKRGIEALDWAREEITRRKLLEHATPQEIDEFVQELKMRYGDTGIINDLLGETFLDPLQVMPWATGKIGSKVSRWTGNETLARALEASTGNLYIDVLPIGIQQVAEAVTGKHPSGGILTAYDIYKNMQRTGYGSAADSHRSIKPEEINIDALPRDLVDNYRELTDRGIKPEQILPLKDKLVWVENGKINIAASQKPVSAIGAENLPLELRAVYNNLINNGYRPEEINYIPDLNQLSWKDRLTGETQTTAPIPKPPQDMPNDIRQVYDTIRSQGIDENNIIYDGNRLVWLDKDGKLSYVNKVVPVTEAGSIPENLKNKYQDLINRGYRPEDIYLDGDGLAWIENGVAKTYHPKTYRARPVPSVEDISALDKYIAGIDDRYGFKELKPHKEAGWLSKLFMLTPEAQAYKLLDTLDLVLASLMESANGDVDMMARMLRQLAGLDEVHAGDIGESILKSPAALAVSEAVKHAINQNDFLDNYMMQWVASENRRTLLSKISRALGEEPQKIVRQLNTDPDTLIRKVNDVAPQLGTAEFLKDMLGVFTGDDAIPYDIRDFQTRLIVSIADNMEGYLKDHFGIKPDSWYFRVNRVLKSAQSLLLLGFSPSYLNGNVINDVGTRAAVGVFGFWTPRHVNNYLKRFRITPPRLDEGIGAGGETMYGGKRIVSDIKRTGDVLDMANDFFRAANRKIGVFSRLSGLVERLESRQATVIAIDRFMSKMWKRGEGFRRLDPAIEAEAESYIPGVTKRIYKAVEGELNVQAAEDALFGDYINVNVDAYVDDVSRSFNPDHPDLVKNLLSETGILDELRSKVSEAKGDSDAVRSAFYDVENNLQHTLELYMANDILARAESARNISKAERVPAILSMITDLEIMEAKNWVDNRRRFEDLYSVRNGMTEAQWRSEIRAEFERQRISFDRMYDTETQTLAGIANALGVSSELGRKIVLLSEQIHGVWRNFNAEATKLRNSFFDSIKRKPRESYDSYLARRDLEWNKLQDTLEELYQKSYEAERSIQMELDDTFANAYSQATGWDVDAARKWRQAIRDKRYEMYQLQREHRKTTRNMTMEERDSAYADFNPVYNRIIAEMKQLEIDGAYDLMKQPIPTTKAAVEAAAETTIPGKPENVTADVYRRLKDYGYTDEEIANFSTSEAFDIANGLTAENVPKVDTILEKAKDFGITDKNGRVVPREVLDIVNNWLRENGLPEAPSLRDVSLDQVQSAFENYAITHLPEKIINNIRPKVAAEDLMKIADVQRNNAEYVSQGILARKSVEEKIRDLNRYNSAEVKTMLHLLDRYADASIRAQGLIPNDNLRWRWYAENIGTEHPFEAYKKLLSGDLKKIYSLNGDAERLHRGLSAKDTSALANELIPLYIRFTDKSYLRQIAKTAGMKVSEFNQLITRVVTGKASDADLSAYNNLSKNFASGWEQYLHNHSAETPELRNLYRDFTDYMADNFSELRNYIGKSKGKIDIQAVVDGIPLRDILDGISQNIPFRRDFDNLLSETIQEYRNRERSWTLDEPTLQQRARERLVRDILSQFENKTQAQEVANSGKDIILSDGRIASADAVRTALSEAKKMGINPWQAEVPPAELLPEAIPLVEADFQNGKPLPIELTENIRTSHNDINQRFAEAVSELENWIRSNSSSDDEFNTATSYANWIINGKKGNPPLSENELLNKTITGKYSESSEPISKVIELLKSPARITSEPIPNQGTYVAKVYRYPFGQYDITAVVYHDGQLAALIPDGFNPKRFTIRNGEGVLLGINPENVNEFVYLVDNTLQTIDANNPKITDRTSLFSTKEPLEPPRGEKGKTALDDTINIERSNPDDPMGSVPLYGTPDINPTAQALNELLSSDILILLQKIKKRILDDAQSSRKFKLGDLPPHLQQKILNWVRTSLRNDYATVKHMALKFGEQMRDAALLNYNQRYGVDNLLDMIFPYQFWYTRSLINWARRMIDKPSWYAMYYRLRRAQEQTNSQLPTRLKGKVRIPAPWMEDWTGQGIWTDPYRTIFPFVQFGQPIEKFMQDQSQITARAKTILDEMVQNEEISAMEAAEAKRSQSGSNWNTAVKRAEAELDRSGNPVNLVTQLMTPALWWTIPYNIAAGTPEKISTLPITRTGQAIRQIGKDTFAEPVTDFIGNIFAKPEEYVREKAGISVYGQYGDLYIDRMLSNMAAEGIITTDQALRAMIERKGTVYEQARQRVEYENSLRVPGTTVADAIKRGASPGELAFAVLTSLFPGGLFPEGELKQRGLQVEYNNAWRKLKNGDPKALQKFFNDHPEYEARLAYFTSDDPEKRLRTFLINNIWDNYFALDEPNRRVAANALGTEFKDFLNEDTRDTENIDLQTLADWAQALGTKLPKTPELENVPEPAPINYYPSNTVKAIEEYKAERDSRFPNYYALQQMYYALPVGAQRKAFLAQFPELKQYWQWNEQYKKTHPELSLYFEDVKREYTVEETANDLDAAILNELLIYATTGKMSKGGMTEMKRLYNIYGKPKGLTFEEYVQLVAQTIFR